MMEKELVVVSGKGGTGKTSIVAALSLLAKDKVVADCDVDAADLHLVLDGTPVESGEFTGGKKAFIDGVLCERCGMCVPLCRFDAVKTWIEIDGLACEGCGVCAHFCPVKAIEMRDHVSGSWFLSETGAGPLVRARLGIAEGNSGKLVTLIRQKARAVARERGFGLILVDGSPGTGCPVIATITGATRVLIVTEPTVAGIHDLKRVFDLARHFRLPVSVCVNRADINYENTRGIREFCRGAGLDEPDEIPYDDEIVRAQVAGRSVVEHSNGPAAQCIRKLWDRISGVL